MSESAEQMPRLTQTVTRISNRFDDDEGHCLLTCDGRE